MQLESVKPLHSWFPRAGKIDPGNCRAAGKYCWRSCQRAVPSPGALYW
jgi:hypothetical protein